MPNRDWLIDLRHLRYFEAVAEELSFSGASRRLRIAQPALSRAVRELETFLGVELFDRSRRQIRLSPAGESLLRDTALLLEQAAEAVRRTRRTAAGEIGELRLGYIGPPVLGFLGPILREYRVRHPEVRIVLEERTPERVWEMVDRGRLSIGLTRPVLAHDALGLRYETLREERLCAAVPIDHAWAGRSRVQWREMGGQPAILLARREGAGSHDAILAACERAGAALRIAHSPSLMSTILRYVEANAGIGIVPESAAAEAASVALVPLVPKATIPLVIVWGSQGDEPAAAAFRAMALTWRDAGMIKPVRAAAIDPPPASWHSPGTRYRRMR